MENSTPYIVAIDRPSFFMGLRPDNIIHTVIKDEAIVNRSVQNQLLEVLDQLKDGINYKLPTVVELGEFISVVDDSTFNQINEFADSLLCIIICAKNAGHRLLAHHYNSRFKPLNDFIIVKDFEQGINYAREKMREHGLDKCK